MENAINALVSALAANYGFDKDSAMTYLKTGNYVDAILSAPKKPGRKPAAKKDTAPAPAPAPAPDVPAPVTAEEPKKRGRKPAAKKEEAPAPPPAPVPVPVEEPKKRGRKPAAPAPAEGAKKEKRIARMTPTLGTQLKTALSNVGVEMTDKIKKEFVAYIEALDEETWRGNSLSDNMRHFAETKAPAPATAPAPTPANEVVQTVEIENTNPFVLTLNDLEKIDLLTPVETAGVFWDGDSGRFVTGPQEEEDEDMNETTFNKKMYVIGEKTGRVYEDENGKDVFVGFKGIGKFKGM